MRTPSACAHLHRGLCGPLYVSAPNIHLVATPPSWNASQMMIGLLPQLFPQMKGAFTFTGPSAAE
jgi:hypothetical protein